MNPKYSFARADLDTSQGLVASLWAQGLGGLVDRVAEDKYRRSYLENPAGHGDCILLLDNASGQAVGVQGFIPRRFWRGNRRVDAAVMADYVVVPEHRFLGPALKLIRSGLELGKTRFAFCYGTPNEKSLGIVRRVGLVTVGHITRYTKVVRSNDYWRRRLPPWLVWPVALVADAAIACADLSQISLRGERFRWCEQAEFGAEFDEIWSQRPADRVFGERSRVALAWRYSTASGNRSWRTMVATDRTGRPAGYVVWRERNGAAMVSDFMCTGPDARLQTFLRSFSWHLRQYHVDRLSLEYFGNEDVVDSLLDCGFAARERTPIVCFEYPGGGVAISQPDAYMTSFDRDHEG